jgi:hypothetical protein
LDATGAARQKSGCLTISVVGAQDNIVARSW